MRERIIQSLGLVAALTALAFVTAGSTLADSGHGFGFGRATYVSNTSGGGVPDASDFPGAGFSAGPGFDWGPGPQPQFGGQGCANPSYTTIGAAVSAASAGDTIVVCPGVYKEDVVVSTPLTLVGIGNPIIDAAGLNNGVQVTASGSTIEGLTVGYATGEGILVGELPGSAGAGTVSNVTITGNTVIGNDQGNPTGASISTSTYAECNAANNTPGDCGEGIHLLSADNSTVSDNSISANSGGILLTDENGPTDGNQISGNDVSSNAYDCGITIAGHHIGTNVKGVFSPVLPTVGGVYNNTIRDNESVNNGVLGQGGGVLLATGTPGGAVYNNTVEGNTLSGNGLAGVTVHAHSPGENLNGNVIRDNTIGVNNLDGDDDFAQTDDSTTGVIVATAVSPISITIVGNRMENDTNGIWLTPNVTATTTPPPNLFVAVTNPIVTAP